MTKLAIVLESSFFSESSRDYYLQIKRSSKNKKPSLKGQDVITYSFGDIYSDLESFSKKPVTFTSTDKFEISRGESYRGSKKLSKNPTLDEFRDFLSQNQITDMQSQNLILHMLLQQHGAISFLIGAVVTGLLSNLHPALLIKPQGYTIDYEFNEGAIKIYLFIPILGGRYLKNDLPRVGMASVCFTVTSDSQITMTPVIIALEETGSFSLQPIRDTISKKSDEFIKPLNIKSDMASEELSKKINLALETKFVIPDNVINFLYKNRKWTGLTALGFLTLLGMLLTVSGIFSPAGILIMFGANLPVLGSLAIDLGIYLMLSAIMGGVTTKILSVFQPTPVLVVPNASAIANETLEIYQITPSKIETQGQKLAQRVKEVAPNVVTFNVNKEDNQKFSDEKNLYALPVYSEQKFNQDDFPDIVSEISSKIQLVNGSSN